MTIVLAPPEMEDDLIPLSALQHYLFCPRQCALIHTEGAWAENVATAEGRLLHEKVDAGGFESRPGVRVARGLQIRSLALGVLGRADAVEFRGKPPVPFPVEYKRGRPKAHRADEVQLCAQAICLEEMCGLPVPEGALYYGARRRRTPVGFDAELRVLTKGVAAQTRRMLAERVTPAPIPFSGCKACSLNDVCRPEQLRSPPRVSSWVSSQIEAASAPTSLPEPEGAP